MNIRIPAAFCCLLYAGMPLFAGTLSTVAQDPGTTVNVIGITGFQTFGSDMAGLQVQATFIQSGVQNCTWAAASATGGGCSVSGFFGLTQDGDTFDTANPWTLTNLSTFDGLTRLILTGISTAGGSSGTVFDRSFSGAMGTLGSANGRDAFGTTTGVADGAAVYRNLVAIAPDAPVGDVFSTLDITFGNGLLPGGSASFAADTDTVGLYRGEVPEPGSASLLGMSLVGLAVALRRRARS